MTSWTQLHNEILEVKPGAPVSLTVDRDGRSLVLQHAAGRRCRGTAPTWGSTRAVNTVFQRQSPIGAIRYVGTGFSAGDLRLGLRAGVAAAAPRTISSTRSERSTSAAGNVSSVVRRGQGHRPGGRGRRGLEAQGLLHPAADRVAEHLRRGVQPAAAAADGRRARRGGDLGDGCRSWFARLRRRPDPGLVDYRKLIPVSFAIFVVLVVFGALLIAADILQPGEHWVTRGYLPDVGSGWASDGPRD